jgi:hypothetical protein
MLPFLAAAGISAGADFLGQYLGHRMNQGMDQKNLQRLLQLSSPEFIGQGANQFMDIFQRSPMYSQMRNRAMMGANQLGNQLQTSYARAGLGSSALGQTATQIGRSSILGRFDDVDMNLFQQALAQSFGRSGAMAGAYGKYPQFSPFGQALGGTIGDIGPFASRLMNHYYPNETPGTTSYTRRA